MNIDGFIAQLVEHRIGNAEVMGDLVLLRTDIAIA